jgi:S1-C subfamily serine protease
MKAVMLSLSELARLASALGGVPISGCLDGSPAHHAGLRYGDVLLSIDGVPTASWSAFFDARRGARRSTVRVFRRGAEFDVTLDLPANWRTPREVLERPHPVLTRSRAQRSN